MYIGFVLRGEKMKKEIRHFNRGEEIPKEIQKEETNVQYQIEGHRADRQRVDYVRSIGVRASSADACVDKMPEHK